MRRARQTCLGVGLSHLHEEHLFLFFWRMEWKSLSHIRVQAIAHLETSETTFSGAMDRPYVICEVKTEITQDEKPSCKWEKQLIRGKVRTMCTGTGAENPWALTVTGATLDNAATITTHHQHGWVPAPRAALFVLEGFCLEANSGKEREVEA